MRGKRSTVVLFVGGLSTDVSSRELKSFMAERLNAMGFRSRTVFSGLIGDCNIMRMTDPESGEIEFHGLIEIRPAGLAMQAIDILNGTLFKSGPLVVHRYRQRSPLQQRQSAAHGANGDRQPRWKKEERRKALKIDLVGSNARNEFRFGLNHK